MFAAQPENANLSDIVRDLLLAIVSSQNQANRDFVAGIEELANLDITIGYVKDTGGKVENREIKGNALAFGLLPTLLTIQSSTVEIRTALSVTKNPSISKASNAVGERAQFLFRGSFVDAKYQNLYSYKAQMSSVIKVTVVPTPPSQALLDAIKTTADKSRISDVVKK